ncbi:hypothetical protein FACS189432_02040 [Bacteroidia bacterium]|nr:hypothetical protein FACS189432_02040 [Bacteroidia bacterium]
MFEFLVSGDEDKMNWIKSVIDQNVQRRMPQPEADTADMDFGDFDIRDFFN